MRRRCSIIAVFVLMQLAGISHAATIAIRAHPISAFERQQLGQRFDHYIHDFKTGDMIIESSDEDWRWLRAQGIKVVFDSVHSAELARRDAKSIPNFPCYPTVSETYTLIDALVAAHPTLASKIDIGDSWEKTDAGGNAGFDLFVLKITNSAIVADKPKLFAMSAVHAREFATAPLNSAFASWLLDNYGTDANATWLVDHNEFHLLLQANPDGRLYIETVNTNQRKNRHYQGSGSGTGIGVDLNRNYPFGWNAFGGSSGTPTNETYRGLAASSEPENQAVVSYINGIFPDRRPGSPDTSDLTTAAASDTRGMFLDIHSVANLVLWPWGMTGTPGSPLTGNNAQFVALGRRLAWFNGYNPTQSNTLPADGASDDNAYASLGVPALTIELGGGSFQADCTTFQNTILPDNLAMLQYAARLLQAPYLLADAPDARDISIAPNLPFAGESISVHATVDDTRFNTSGGVQPTQNIQTASAYFDFVPWQAAAVAMPLSAVDNSFNSPTEAVVGTLTTSGLGIGRHTLFVDASDSGGKGPPNAVFFDLVDPSSVGTLLGTVRDAITMAPLMASISTGNESIFSDSNGGYSYRSLPTTLDLVARSTGYIDEPLAPISFVAGQTQTHDIDMLPTCAAFVDDAQSGNIGWTAQSPWGMQSGIGINGVSTTFWTDSPNGNYANSANVSLTSPTRSFSGVDGVRLEFDHRCVTEATYDFGNVEYSINGGNTWSSYVFRCDGEGTWRHQSIALPQLDNQSNTRVRFRLTSDNGVALDGWSIDNIRLESAGPACRALQLNSTAVFKNGFE